jgi:rhodanese-related sulfurtransferase
LGKRADNFHELCTVFQSVSLHDDLTFYESNEIILTCNDKNIPVDELQSRALQELSAGRPIVLYCGCSTDELGNIAIDILRETLPGDADVKVLKGGLDAWAKEGLQIVNKILTKYNQ